MQLVNLVRSIINTQHGWAVAEQFEDSFNDGDFEEQNLSALYYILDTVKTLLDSGLLSEDAYDELDEYKKDLENYMP